MILLAGFSPSSGLGMGSVLLRIVGTLGGYLAVRRLFRLPMNGDRVKLKMEKLKKREWILMGLALVLALAAGIVWEVLS